MSLALSIAIYFVCWWIVLFAILPLRFGAAKTAEQDVHAEHSGAPQMPQLALKFLITTVVAGIVFAAIYVVIAYQLISLDDIPFLRV